MSRTLALLLVVAATLALLGAGAFLVRVVRTQRPNVVVIVADTLRADRLGAYGNRRGLTPFLDELAARGVVFRNAYAASSWTCPSVASLFTSRYPSQHHVTGFDSKLAASELTVAERLRASWYATAGFSANLRLTEQTGYAQGFRLFRPFVSHRKVTTDRVARKSLAWLQRVGARWLHRLPHPWSRPLVLPLFLYYQLMEPHSPYDPAHEPGARELLRIRTPPPGDDDGARAASANARLVGLRWDELGPADVSYLETLYDDEAALLDRRLRGLFAGLQRLGVLDHAIVVFTADHGEEFRDHGQLLHGTSLFEEAIRVPLIVLLPGHAGQVVDDQVSLVDVGPTLLDALGLPPEPRFEGRSLLPLLDGVSHRVDILAEQPPSAGEWDLGRHAVALIRGRTKVLVPRDGTTPVLYDLASDPFETVPDPPALAASRSALVAAAREAIGTLASRAGPEEHQTVDARTRARLRALGYAN